MNIFFKMIYTVISIYFFLVFYIYYGLYEKEFSTEVFMFKNNIRNLTNQEVYNTIIYLSNDLLYIEFNFLIMTILNSIIFIFLLKKVKK